MKTIEISENEYDMLLRMGNRYVVRGQTPLNAREVLLRVINAAYNSAYPTQCKEIQGRDD